MLYRAQLLTKPDYQPGARNAVIGRAWLNIGKPTRRIAKAEQLLRSIRIDRPDAVLRIQEVAA
ncbi:hypothetical protein [Bradyrhizobium genosp. P]|uniref:hypothetical protein n=1 Tax=Bradyrhizobium genosp. P TaxID=83641 RepID=UPI003CF90486